MEWEDNSVFPSRRTGDAEVAQNVDIIDSGLKKYLKPVIRIKRMGRKARIPDDAVKALADKKLTSYELAELLKVSQTTAWRKQKKLGLNNADYRPKKERGGFDWVYEGSEEVGS